MRVVASTTEEDGAAVYGEAAGYWAASYIIWVKNFSGLSSFYLRFSLVNLVM